MSNLSALELKVVLIALSSQQIKGSDAVAYSKILEKVGKLYEKAEAKELNNKDANV